MKRFGVAILAAALFWAPAASAGQPEEAAESVFSQWHSFYLDGRKIGYRTVSLHRLPGGGHRIKISLFLKRKITDTKVRYLKTIRAEVDAAGRPRALDCQVASGARRWRVKGERLDDSFRLTRTVGEEETKAFWPPFWAVRAPRPQSRTARRGGSRAGASSMKASAPSCRTPVWFASSGRAAFLWVAGRR